MKHLILVIIGLFSFNISIAKATLSFEVAGVGPCNGVEVDDDYNRLEYLTNGQGQVKIDIEMENSLNSDSIGYDTDSFRTPVIANLLADESIIKHIPTGVVCAVYKKASLIGGKTWVDRSACKIVTKETYEKLYDKDGFYVGKACTREYQLQIKVKN